MFTINTTDIIQAAILSALGIKVTPYKKAASPRCLFEIPDNPEVRAILDAYETRQVMPVPHKDFITAYRKMLSACKDLKQGRVGGVL